MKIYQNILLCIALSTAFVLSSPLISPDLASPTAHSAGMDPDVYPPPVTVGEFRNVSTRGMAASGDEAMVSGFSVVGGSVDLAVRALGPDLTRQQVQGSVMEDPLLQVFQGENEIQRNDDWADAENAESLEALGLAPIESSEAALLTTLEPGDYTSIVEDQAGGSGIGLFEIFKAGGSGQLVGLTTRGRVSGGAAALVGGFIPSATMTVLITAIGPSLQDQGVSDALQDPKLVLYYGQRRRALNDDWERSQHADFLREEGLAPTDPRESAIVITLSPWERVGYSAILHSADGSSGVGQIKIEKLFE